MSKPVQLLISLVIASAIFAGVYYGVRALRDIGGDVEPSGGKETVEDKELETSERVMLKTNFGDIEIEMFTEKAPNTTSNFLSLSRQGFYDGTRFHRIIEGFMIQGGDPFSKDVNLKDRWGTGGPGYTFEDEINDEKIVRGIVAMANAGPNTNGSQFFIVTALETPWLDGEHTAFGKVVSGMEVIEEIEKIPTTGEGNLPLEDALINEVVVVGE